jgi:hypothetical protein
MAWRIRIPEDESHNLLFFIHLTDDSFEKLASALEGSTPSIHVGTFIRRVLVRSEITDQDSAYEALVSLSSISGTAFSHAEMPERIARDIAVQLTTMEGISSEESGIFKRRLLRLLLIRNVALVSQSFSASVQGKSLFQRCTVSTEMVPLYRPDSETSELLGGAIFHDLFVAFSSEGRDAEFNCRFDTEDLLELKKAIQRALDERVPLEIFLRQSGLSLVSDSSEISE